MQELSALEHVVPMHTRRARVPGIMESARVQPETIDSAAKIMTFGGSEQTSVFEVVFPFLERVDLFPFFGDAAYFEELLEKSEGGGDGADEVRGLAGVVGHELDGVLEGAELGFGSAVEDGKTLGGGEDGAEVVAC